MRNGGTPASSRLLFAACKRSLSAAESSPEEDSAAEFDGGEGGLLWMSLLRTSAAGEVDCAAHGPGITANIARETAKVRSMIVGGTFLCGGCRESSAFHLSREPLEFSSATYDG